MNMRMEIGKNNPNQRAEPTEGHQCVLDLINMFNPAAFLRLSQVRSLLPLLVLYYFKFSFLCTIWKLVWSSLSLN